MDYKQRIIEDAAVLFRTYGIRAVTMDMLANQMGISKRTIYEVFRDKDELLEGVLRWMTEKQREVLAKIMDESENVIEAIFKLLDLMRDHFHNMSPAFQLDIKKYRHKMLSDADGKGEMHISGFNEEIVRQGIKEGIFRVDIDVPTINMCLLEVSKMSNDNELFSSDDFQKKNVIRNVYINYLRGISTQKGLDLISIYEKQKS
jgi:TetR/AcrR family transcriptional regulator, cholesterol catabolism regulator